MASEHRAPIRILTRCPATSWADIRPSSVSVWPNVTDQLVAAVNNHARRSAESPSAADFFPARGRGDLVMMVSMPGSEPLGETR
jgi:hypothetical protein